MENYYLLKEWNMYFYRIKRFRANKQNIPYTEQ